MSEELLDLILDNDAVFFYNDIGLEILAIELSILEPECYLEKFVLKS